LISPRGARLGCKGVSFFKLALGMVDELLAGGFIFTDGGARDLWAFSGDIVLC